MERVASSPGLCGGQGNEIKGIVVCVAGCWLRVGSSERKAARRKLSELVVVAIFVIDGSVERGEAGAAVVVGGDKGIGDEAIVVSGSARASGR